MNKVYAVSDLHGMYGLWEKIKNYIDETDTIYFLGDAADRGPHGIKIMQELLTDKRVKYILGNHEDIMLREAPDMIEGRSFSSCLWYGNGGGPTADAFERLSEDSQIWLLNKINQLPREATYVNKNGQTIFMCHAGTNPGWNEFHWGQKGVHDAYIWSRAHFHDEWEDGYEDYFIVHGHTPTPLLQKCFFWSNEIDREAEIFRYANNHKIDIDCGCFFTGHIALLDLDTLEPIYFEDEKLYSDYKKGVE